MCMFQHPQRPVLFSDIHIAVHIHINRHGGQGKDDKTNDALFRKLSLFVSLLSMSVNSSSYHLTFSRLFRLTFIINFYFSLLWFKLFFMIRAKFLVFNASIIFTFFDLHQLPFFVVTALQTHICSDNMNRCKQQQQIVTTTKESEGEKRAIENCSSVWFSVSCICNYTASNINSILAE